MNMNWNCQLPRNEIQGDIYCLPQFKITAEWKRLVPQMRRRQIEPLTTGNPNRFDFRRLRWTRARQK